MPFFLTQPEIDCILGGSYSLLPFKSKRDPPSGDSGLAGRNWTHLESSCLLALSFGSLLWPFLAASFLQMAKPIFLEESLESRRRKENAISSSSPAIAEVSKASSISLSFPSASHISESRGPHGEG